MGQEVLGMFFKESCVFIVAGEGWVAVGKSESNMGG